MSMWNEIVLKITGKANVKPALDQAKKDAQGFQLKDLLGGEGGEKAMRAIRGGMLLVAGKLGLEIGKKISEGLEDSAGFFQHYWRKFQTYAVEAALKAEQKLKSVLDYTRAAARAGEQIRLKKLNEDLDKATRQMDNLAKVSAAERKGAAQIDAGNFATQAAGETSSFGKQAVTQAAELAAANAELVDLKARQAEEERKSVMLQEAAATAAQEEKTARDEVLRISTENAAKGDKVTSSDLAAAQVARDRLALAKEQAKATAKAVETANTEAAVLKTQVETQGQLLDITKARQDAEKQVLADQQKSAMLGKVAARLEGGVAKTGIEAVLGVGDVVPREDAPGGWGLRFRRRGLMDASLEERMARMDAGVDAAARRAEAATGRRQESVARAAAEYQRNLARRMAQGQTQSDAEAAMAKTRGAKAAALVRDAEAAAQAKLAMQQLEKDGWLAMKAAKGFLENIDKRLQMPIQ